MIKFATRIPVFMYLTDFREMSLVDVITELEPELFKKVTGLNVKDFELLVSLNVFNEGLMNDAVYKFKRYEDASLTYTGIDKHTGENVGLYNTVISRDDYNAMAGLLEQSKKPDENVDYGKLKVKAGMLVSHERFGTGQVKGLDGSVLVVTFGKFDKKFAYPEVFEKGLLEPV